MRPRLLDLFCGAGGSGMGYSRAGFDVVGIDIEPQPNYPFEFHRQDVMKWLRNATLPAFDAIHASPPCPHYANVTRWRGDQNAHPDYLPEVRELLDRIGLPWVIENVMGAPMRPDFILCGSMFGLPIRRHRMFETSWGAYELVQPCSHSSADLPFMHKGERAYADALGCPWMTAREGRDAIPPAYCEYIGEQLLQALKAAA